MKNYTIYHLTLWYVIITKETGANESIFSFDSEEDAKEFVIMEKLSN